jgi:hypothetical protein
LFLPETAVRAKVLMCCFRRAFKDDLRRIDEIAPQDIAAGTRYPEAGMKNVNV